VERLSDVLRPQATYRRSLEVLRMASGLGSGRVIKSSLMVGLGETAEELIQSFQDLRASGVTHLTVGQYLRPDADHLPVMEYVSPERFRHYEQLARDHGFAWVLAGPYVRSSYHAVDAVSSLDSHGSLGTTPSEGPQAKVVARVEGSSIPEPVEVA
jgi:lipoic acid synthetase